MRRRLAAVMSVRVAALILSVIVVATLVVVVATRVLAGNRHGPTNSHVVNAIGAAPYVVIPAGEDVTYIRKRSMAQIRPANDPLFQRDRQLGTAYSFSVNKEPTSAAMSFPINAARLRSAVQDSSASPNELSIQIFEPSLRSWVPLPTQYNSRTETVTAYTDHLSNFVLTWAKGAASAADPESGAYRPTGRT